MHNIQHLNIDYLDILCKILGYSGGDIHSICAEIGIQKTMLDTGIFDANSEGGIAGFMSIGTNPIDFNRNTVFPRYIGNIDFWLSAIHRKWMQSKRIL